MLDLQNINTWKVLVVDNEPDNCAVIKDVLEFYGVDVVKVAKNGAEGLEVLEHFKPTLILLDLSMPRMDGWEMLKHLKAKSEAVTASVIALTAHALPEDQIRVMAAGFDGYLQKPINVMMLLEDLRAVLKRTLLR
ncbi:MAG TPA: response regulator [Aggregatilineaceae bacterium]|nr:response regulator [Aggregatilineaceae bacterium]